MKSSIVPNDKNSMIRTGTTQPAASLSPGQSLEGRIALLRSRLPGWERRVFTFSGSLEHASVSKLLWRLKQLSSLRQFVLGSVAAISNDLRERQAGPKGMPSATLEAIKALVSLIDQGSAAISSEIHAKDSAARPKRERLYAEYARPQRGPISPDRGFDSPLAGPDVFALVTAYHRTSQ
jgi:hypothetical protein